MIGVVVRFGGHRDRVVEAVGDGCVTAEYRNIDATAMKKHDLRVDAIWNAIGMHNAASDHATV